MNMTFCVAICLFTIIALCSATSINKCPGFVTKPSPVEVLIKDCVEPKCIFQKGTTYDLTWKFIPVKNIASLTHRVYVEYCSTLKIPFSGVDGSSACSHVYNADGVAPAGCPLTAGVAYVYKNQFLVKWWYPSLNMYLHYALQSEGDDVNCFEVAMQIKG